MQVYTERTDGNYEGRADYWDGSARYNSGRRNNRQAKKAIIPYKAEMIKHYDRPKKHKLL